MIFFKLNICKINRQYSTLQLQSDVKIVVVYYFKQTWKACIINSKYYPVTKVNKRICHEHYQPLCSYFLNFQICFVIEIFATDMIAIINTCSSTVYFAIPYSTEN